MKLTEIKKGRMLYYDIDGKDVSGRLCLVTFSDRTAHPVVWFEAHPADGSDRVELRPYIAVKKFHGPLEYHYLIHWIDYYQKFIVAYEITKEPKITRL